MPCLSLGLRSRLWVAIGGAAALTACSTSPSATTRAATPSSSQALATLDLSYDKPAVGGAAARATASGLPAGKHVDLSWGSVTGGWVIEDYYHFRGKKYSETATSLGQFPVDSSGRLDARFVIPEDYGGVHEVIARIQVTVVLARELTKKFEEFLRGTPAKLLEIAQKRSLKGEFVVLVKSSGNGHANRVPTEPALDS